MSVNELIPQEKHNDDLASSPDWLSRTRIPSPILGSPNHIAIPKLIQEGFTIRSPRKSICGTNYDRSFFQPLLVGNEKQRHTALQHILELLESALNENSSISIDLITSHIGTIVRLSTECPFPEVRNAFQSFLVNLQRTAPSISIPSPQWFSSFFDASDSSLPYLLGGGEETDAEFVARLCQLAFLHKSRMSHFVQLLAWHPSYLDKFYQTYDHLMYDGGPLPNDWSSYIAIMASSRHFCSYLVESQEQEFIDADGDKSWLNGIQFIPSKLKALGNINQILAHQPWRLNASHIADICGSGENDWSLGELVHAILIMTTFHSMSGIVWTCGILPEVKDEDDYKADLSGSSSEEEQYNMPTMRLLEALSTSDDDANDSIQQSNLFEKVDTENQQRISKRRGSRKNALSKYRGEYVMAHEDFDIKEYIVFHISDYTWKDQGYALVNEYFPTITPLLDDQFRKIYTLTYNTFSTNVDVDTARFRMAVWHYVHRVQGIFHDDYSYEKVNFWLNIRLKRYIKTLVCYPHTVKKSDFQNMGIILTPQEKVHLSLLATEARKQSAILYGLRAIMKYQAESSRSSW